MILRICVLATLAACRPSSQIVIDVEQLRRALAFGQLDSLGEATLMGEGAGCQNFGPLRLELANDDTFTASVPACPSAQLLLRVERAARADESEGVTAFVSRTTVALAAGAVTTVIFPALRAGEIGLALRGTEGERCDAELTDNGSVVDAAQLVVPADARFALPSSRTYALRCTNVAGFVPIDIAVEFASRTFVQLTLPVEQSPSPVAMPQRVPLFGPEAAYVGQTLIFDIGPNTASVLRWRARGREITSCGKNRVCALIAEGTGTLNVEAELDAMSPQGTPVIATRDVALSPLAPKALTIESVGGLAMIPNSANGGKIVISASDSRPDGASVISTALPEQGAMPPFAIDDGRARCTLVIDDATCSDFVVTDQSIAANDSASVTCDSGAVLGVAPVLDVFVDSALCGRISLLDLGSADVRVRFSPTATVNATNDGDGLFIVTGGHLFVDGPIAISHANDLAGVADSDASPDGNPDRKLLQLDAGTDKTIYIGGPIKVSPGQFLSTAWGMIVGPGFSTTPSARVVVADDMVTSSVDQGEGTSPPGYIVLRGRQVYLPNLRTLDARGASVVNAGFGTPGNGGRVSLVASSPVGGALREEIQMHGPIPVGGDANLRISVSAGLATSPFANDAASGGKFRIETGKPGNSPRGGDGWVALFGSVDADATVQARSSTLGAIGGEPIDMQMICSGACVASLIADFAARGTTVTLNATLPNLAGQGGSLSLVQGNLAPDSALGSTFLTVMPRANGCLLDGGGVVGASNALDTSVTGGNGGTVRLAQQFLSTGHRAAIDWSANVSARGGACDVSTQPPTSASTPVPFQGGDGGTFSIEQLLTSGARVDLVGATFDLSGGAMIYPVGATSPLWTGATGGAGGDFTIEQASANPGGTTQLTDVVLLAAGGNVSLDRGNSATSLRAGDGGDVVLRHDPTTSGTLMIDTGSSRTGSGGSAVNTSPTASFFHIDGGNGGASLIDYATVTYPAAWSECPARGSLGGNAQGLAVSRLSGSDGQCTAP